MYQFIGDASGTDSLDFQPLFADYENNPGTCSKLISKFCACLTCCYKELFNHIHVHLIIQLYPSQFLCLLFVFPSSLLSSLFYLLSHSSFAVYLSLILLPLFFCLSPSTSSPFLCCFILVPVYLPIRSFIPPSVRLSRLVHLSKLLAR